MSGLSSTMPHYMFLHDLSLDGFDRWAQNGLDYESGDEQERLLPVYMGSKVSQVMEWFVLELDKVELDMTALGNLAFQGTVQHTVAGIGIQLNCTGYIARRRSEKHVGTGVMWIQDGVTQL